MINTGTDCVCVCVHITNKRAMNPFASFCAMNVCSFNWYKNYDSSSTNTNTFKAFCAHSFLCYTCNCLKSISGMTVCVCMSLHYPIGFSFYFGSSAWW